ncbi:MAG: dephospho-CoA kinase [Gammaproteobacteria bacterium]|nr:MAG: dephospho-CoA kinase [Gammaproteobacteria bacterium]RKZ76645.1 MAG: dephospho-CoA kinase [Gammaproteobacteria bacterium]
MPLKIGLTGGIATGKTTVSKLFAIRGIPIIDADEIAHQIVAPGQPALKRIIEIFGSIMIGTDGKLNRTKLREHIFANSEQRLRLEAILHPAIREIMLAKTRAIKKPICILSIPLLVETQQVELVDRVLVVDCPVALQRERLISCRGLSLLQIEQILKAQANRNTRLAIADDIIYNDADYKELEEQVIKMVQKYRTIPKNKP